MRSMKIPKKLQAYLDKFDFKIEEYHMEQDYFGEPHQGPYSIWITLKDGYINPRMETRTIHSPNVENAIQELLECVKEDIDDEDDEDDYIEAGFAELNKLLEAAKEILLQRRKTYRKGNLELVDIGFAKDEIALFVIEDPDSPNARRVIRERPIIQSMDGRDCMVLEDQTEIELFKMRTGYKGELLSIGELYDNAIPMDEFIFRMRHPELSD